MTAIRNPKKSPSPSLVAALLVASLSAQFMPRPAMAEVQSPNWVEMTPDDSLCRAHSEALRIHEHARDEVRYIKERINLNRKLGKRAKTSEEFRRAVTAMVAGYLAASATMSALGGGFRAGSATGTSTARLAVSAAAGMIEGCQALVHLTVASASFMSTTMIVGLIGKWISDPDVEKLLQNGTPAQRIEFENRQQSISQLKENLQEADGRLAAFSETALRALHPAPLNLSPEETARHATRALLELRNYEAGMRALLQEVDASTVQLQTRIEEHCEENKLTCALGFSRKGNASDWLELESSLIQDRALKNTALAIQAGNVIGMVDALVRANHPGEDAQSLCAP